MIEAKRDEHVTRSHFRKQPSNNIEYLSLDPLYVDTSVVREIGIAGETSYVQEKFKDRLIQVNFILIKNISI